jgi:mono/diheme cytochrome c family protein
MAGCAAAAQGLDAVRVRAAGAEAVTFAALLLASQLDGAALYRMHCSVPYCHGPAGTGGRAPTIAGRNYEPARLREIVANGIPTRGMPAFRKQLGDAAIDAVVAYVLKLPSPSAPKGPPPPAPRSKLPAEVVTGRDLFFDSARLPGCAACHVAGQSGGGVGPPLTSQNAPDVDAIRHAATPGVQTVRVPGETPFPAIVAGESGGVLKIYDVGGRLPVLRTVRKADVRLEAGSWDHKDLAARYSQRELESIAVFIRYVAGVK